MLSCQSFSHLVLTKYQVALPLSPYPGEKKKKKKRGNTKIRRKNQGKKYPERRA